MKYNIARPQIQSGDLIGITHDGIGSDIVCFFTRSKFSHVAIAWRVGERVMLLEAVIPRVRIFPLSKNRPFTWVPLGKPLNQETEEYALSKIGEEYSVQEACKGLFGLTKKDNKWQCAEYARAILRKNGMMFDVESTPEAIMSRGLKINGGISYSVEA